MATTVECETCGRSGGREVTVEEKDPPGQLIMMCDHTTEFFSLEEYGADDLPPASELPKDWVRVDPGR